MNSVYKINKGINRPIEFKGLKAQYIGYLAIGLVGLLILFTIIYISGVNMFVCVVLISGLGVGLFVVVYRLSDKYGQHGLTKMIARSSTPKAVKVRTRKYFLDLSKTKKYD